MTRPRKKGAANTQSTYTVKEAPVPASVDPDTHIILDNHSPRHVFCCAALAAATTGTFYTDTTGSFPVTSLENI